MAEAEVFELVAQSIKSGAPVALVTVIDHAGSTPGKQGSVMAVLGNGVTSGSVGGGELEYTVIRQALDCLKAGTGGEFSYKLAGLEMACGGDVRIYIKVYKGSDRLIICGGGHIGAHLCELAVGMQFAVTVIDSRVEFASAERFPGAEVIHADPASALEGMDVADTYIAIATHSHETDESALRESAARGAKYVGMIGSSKKVNGVLGRMRADGYTDEILSGLYTPMGLNIASVKPEEIAFSVLSEILLVKNSGSADHMRDVKKKK